MSYLEKAVKLLVEEFEGHVDKGGNPYIFHLLRVMNKMSGDMQKTVAVLHDLLEDMDLTEVDLKNKGFPDHLIEILTILNKNRYRDYDDYIDHVLQNDMAVKVKLADLEDNMDITRLKKITEKDAERLRNYHKAWKLLSS